VVGVTRSAGDVGHFALYPASGIHGPAERHRPQGPGLVEWAAPRIAPDVVALSFDRPYLKKERMDV
jgi:hypothetical protein